MQKIEIPVSKTKLVMLAAGSALFVVVGILFALNPEKFVTPILNNPVIVRLAGLAAVLFFGFAGIYGLRKIFDKSVGLLLDEVGITDHSNASSVGLIKWVDIVAIETQQVMQTQFILIFVNNPDEYLHRASGWKQKLMKGNQNMYGTPLSITTNSLQIKFEQLLPMLLERFDASRAVPQNK